MIKLYLVFRITMGIENTVSQMQKRVFMLLVIVLL